MMMIELIIFMSIIIITFIQGAHTPIGAVFSGALQTIDYKINNYLNTLNKRKIRLKKIRKGNRIDIYCVQKLDKGFILSCKITDFGLKR